MLIIISKSKHIAHEVNIDVISMARDYVVLIKNVASKLRIELSAVIQILND